MYVEREQQLVKQLHKSEKCFKSENSCFAYIVYFGALLEYFATTLALSWAIVNMVHKKGQMGPAMGEFALLISPLRKLIYFAPPLCTY